jgi:ribosomal protein S18 acetylase RimI-like enzyme
MAEAAPPAAAAAAPLPAPFSSKPAGTALRTAGARDLFYTGVHARNIGTARKIVEVVLPVPYSDDFYRRLQEAPPELARLAYYRDICVGVLGCRVEAAEGAAAAAAAAAPAAADGAAAPAAAAAAAIAPAAPAAPPRVYMTVLAVLAPYRDMGIGSALLRGLLEAMEGGKIAGAEGARELYLHVWEENKEAVREKREGAGAGAVAPAGPADGGASRGTRHTPHAPPRSTTPPPPSLRADCLLPARRLCRRRGKGGELLQAHR